MGERRYSFDEFTLDLARACLLRHGREVKLRPKSYEAFKYLAENPGRLVTKDELIRVLWPDSFVTDDSLVKCLRDVRAALGDEGHLYIKTVPRRGYIFDAPDLAGAPTDERLADPVTHPSPDAGSAPVMVGSRLKARSAWGLVAVLVAASLAGAAYLASPMRTRAGGIHEGWPQLVRLTSDPGVQSEPAWSPDGRLVAYSADRSGNLDIWVKPIGSGNAIQLTTSPAHDWQADWSPDGSQIAFRSERDGGGLFVMSALGGRERRISPFGFRPRWSPDGSQLLFTGTLLEHTVVPPQLYVVRRDGQSSREVLAATVAAFRWLRAAWHPDGRISLWGDDRSHGRTFLTVAPGDGAALRSEVAEGVARQLDAEGAPAMREFFWAPSGDAVYFEGVSQGIRNLWRIRVDPRTLRWIAGPDRLTVGPGPDLDATLSRDGKRLAYTTRRESVRFWLFPFDTDAGIPLESGQPLTSSELNVIDGELAPDGRSLVFGAERAGRSELWERSLEDGTEVLLADDNFARSFPRWSRDGKFLAYLRSGRGAQHTQSIEHSLVLRAAGAGAEQVLSSPQASVELPSDWSRDGQWVLASSSRGTAGRHRICWFPLAGAPRAESGMRVLVSDTGRDLWHGRLSPDGRWVSFHAVDVSSSTSNVYVMRAEGGPWIPVTASQSWSGKARWDSSGRALYFISNRSGLFEIWSVPFDPVAGAVAANPIKVLHMEGNGRGISLAGSPPSGLSFAAGRLVLPLKESSGSVWMLEGIQPW